MSDKQPLSQQSTIRTTYPSPSKEPRTHRDSKMSELMRDEISQISNSKYRMTTFKIDQKRRLNLTGPADLRTPTEPSTFQLTQVGGQPYSVPYVQPFKTSRKQVFNASMGNFRVKDIIEEDKKDLLRDNRRSFVDLRLSSLKPTIHKPSVDGFRTYYENLHKYSQYQEMTRVETNIYGKMNNKIKENKLLPRTLQMFQHCTDRLVANNQFGSDAYVEVFVEGLSAQNFRDLRHLSLRDNHINSKRMALLMQHLPVSIVELDLSGNNFGLDGGKSLNTFINRSYLQVLHLEDNKLRDLATLTIVKVLTDSRSIRVLNLSNNQISCQSMDGIGQLLRKSQCLEELFLHFNQIKHNGGITLFKAMLKNQYLKVLDMSFNKLGGNKECATAVADAIGKPHPELMHLDLSYNSFNADDALLIQKNLVYNQNIYGLHFQGNVGFQVNPRGYLVSQEGDLNEQPQHRRISGVDCIEHTTMDNCWICEGWFEVKFTWRVGISGAAEYPIFLHLDFEDYRPVILKQDGNSRSLELIRMCPPNRVVKYFFSNPLMDTQFVAKDQKSIRLDKQDQLHTTGVSLQYADGTIMMSQRIGITNYIRTGINKLVIDGRKHYIPTVACKPRETERIFDIDPKQAKAREWSVDNSVFSDFQADNEGHIMDCFDYDFECGKLQKHIFNPEDLEDLKSRMQQVYKHILACYRYYCAQTLNYDLPLVNQQCFLDFMSQTSILDKQLMNSVDLQLTFLSSYVVQRSKEFIYVQDRCLVRFQFMDIIIRLAKEQYLRTNICRGIGDAVQRLLRQDHLKVFIEQFGVSQDWRDERYWTQLMDATVKFKWPILMQLYEFTAKLSYKHHRSVSLMDMKVLVHDHCELTKYVTEKELYLIYLQSMQTQRDEVMECKHTQMQPLEFIEALARLSELISPVSPMYTPLRPLNKAFRKTLPLFVKFEGLIYVIYMKLKQQLKCELQMEQDVVCKSILKTGAAKRMGIYEEDKSSDSESEEKPVVSLLPEDEVDESPRKKLAASGWKKLKKWASRRKLVESTNILKHLSTYQEQDEIMDAELFETGHMYEKLEIKKKREQRDDFKRKSYEEKATFNFEQKQ